MGIQGYRGYRHRGRFIYWHTLYDSEPRCLGLSFLRQIPGPDATPEDFQEWLVSIREQLDCLDGLSEVDGLYEEYEISSEHPVGILIGWTYIADLDNLVFHIDGVPLFRLDHLPPPDIFLSCIGVDHYENRAYHDAAPIEYRYNWTAPPPTPCIIGLTAYRDHALKDNIRPIHEILTIPEDLLKAEQSCVAMLEILVGNHMANGFSSGILHELENLPSRDLMPRETKSLAFAYLSLSLYPKIFPHHLPTDVDLSHEFIWLHGREGSFCLYITTHLDDEANCHAAVGKLVNEVLREAGSGVDMVYGVAFSIFHCVIISVDFQSGRRCQHTPALRFLPSWFADSRSTPGIVALARLGLRIGFDLSLSTDSHAMILSAPAKRKLPSGGSEIGWVFPADICDEIVQYLYDPIDVLNFGSLSPPCKVSAMRILRYPHVANHRLLSRSRVPVPPSDKQSYPQLYSANFDAVMESGPMIMRVGPGWGSSTGSISGRIDFLPASSGYQGLYQGLQLQGSFQWQYIQRVD
jgi:hypothetical protein